VAVRACNFLYVILSFKITSLFLTRLKNGERTYVLSRME
jgi:hypothetical protein